MCGLPKESAKDYMERLKEERKIKLEGMKSYLSGSFDKYIKKHGNIEFNTARDVKDYLYTTFDVNLKHEINKLGLNDDELLSLFQEAVITASESLAEAV